MKVNNKKAIYNFKLSHSDSVSQLDAWQEEVKAASWANPNELKQTFCQASILKAGNVIFNIHSGKYRLWTIISYKLGVVFVKAIGTHKEYEKWDIR